MTNYIFEYRDKVRDYECDLQGIVNNANYQHYLEHARHEFLAAHGVNFADLHQRGTDAVVARITMQFKVPLRSGDQWVCKLWVKKEGVKWVFMQDVYRVADMKLCVRGQVDTVCLVNGVLGESEELNERFLPLLKDGNE
ncbi:MAG: acyl-CoA thioesterase [Bacteroidaceae bacterium]|nr:acyl-CoA thioesterase [Bacteroidaceae bacterium]